MKRMLVLLLSAAFLLGVCGCAGKGGEPDLTQQADNTAEATEAAPSPEPTEEPEAETAPEFIDLSCMYVNSSRGREIDGGVTYHVETVYIAEGGENSALNSALDMSGFARINELYEDYFDLLYDGRDPASAEPVDPFFTLLSSLACVRRADSGMISVLYSTRLTRTGVDKSYVDCLNVSASDGRILTIGDVIENTDNLLACVNGELEAYGEYSITEEDLGDLAWTMDHSCMTVYFSVKNGKFADIASVCPSVALWYSAHPILFAEEYLPEGTIHSAMFPMDMPYYAEIGGMMSGLSVAHELDADGDRTGGLVITLNGREFVFADPAAFGTVLNAVNYFMHTAYGDFVIVEGSEIFDEALPETPVLHVFAVEGGEVVYRGLFHGGVREWDGENNTSDIWSSYRQLPTDPREFGLNESEGTLFGLKTWRMFRIGAGGMPEPVDDSFYVDGEQLFLLKTDITADKLNDAGEADGSADISEQMALRLISSDGESFCDMYAIEMDIYVRLYIENGGAVINGMNAGDLWIYVTDGVAVG